MTQAAVTSPNHPACVAVRRDGRPCQAPALSPGRHCYMHDPDRAAERREARQRGGRNHSTAARAERLLPARLRPVCFQLEGALVDVLAGRLDPRSALAVAALARALVVLVQAGELELRLRALEEGRQPGEVPW